MSEQRSGGVGVAEASEPTSMYLRLPLCNECFQTLSVPVVCPNNDQQSSGCDTLPKLPQPPLRLYESLNRLEEDQVKSMDFIWQPS